MSIERIIFNPDGDLLLHLTYPPEEEESVSSIELANTRKLTRNIGSNDENTEDNSDEVMAHSSETLSNDDPNEGTVGDSNVAHESQGIEDMPRHVDVLVSSKHLMLVSLGKRLY